MEANITTPRLMRVADVAILLYGSATIATKARVTRMCDRGDLRTVRIGTRGDRWVPRESVEALLAGLTEPSGRNADRFGTLQ